VEYSRFPRLPGGGRGPVRLEALDLRAISGQKVRSECGRVTGPGVLSAARVAGSRYAFGSTPQRRCATLWPSRRRPSARSRARRGPAFSLCWRTSALWCPWTEVRMLTRSTWPARRWPPDAEPQRSTDLGSQTHFAPTFSSSRTSWARPTIGWGSRAMGSRSSCGRCRRGARVTVAGKDPLIAVAENGDPGGIRTRDLDLERVASWARLDDGVSPFARRQRSRILPRGSKPARARAVPPRRGDLTPPIPSGKQ
jgi:hypothetical protein